MTQGHLSSSTRVGYGFLCVGLVLFSGCCSGLTLGLLSLDRVDLEVLVRSGSEAQKRYATAVAPIVAQGHRLLVTLLLLNAAAMARPSARAHAAAARRCGNGEAGGPTQPAPASVTPPAPASPGDAANLPGRAHHAPGRHPHLRRAPRRAARKPVALPPLTPRGRPPQ